MLARRWPILILGAAAGAALAVAVTSQKPVRFEATATIQLTAATSHPSGLFSIAGVSSVLGHQEIATAVVKEFGLSDPPHQLTPQTLLAEAYTLEHVPGTLLLRQSVRLREPELAARVAASMAEQGVELAARLWREVGGTAGVPHLEQQAERARALLADAEQRMLAYRARAGIEPLREEPISRRKKGRPVAELYARELALVRLETEVETKRQVFIELSARHERARIELASTPAPLRLIEAPVVPERPVPVHRARTLALGMLAGLVLALCLVIARDWREQGEEHWREETGTQTSNDPRLTL